MSNSPPSPGPDLFYAGGECLTRFGVWVRRTDMDLEEATSEVATRASDATAIGRDGIIRTWEPDAPRAEWLNEVDLGIGADLDRKFPALYLEGPQTTNGWTFSEEIDNAVWTKTRSTVSANFGIAPDGEATADKLVESVGSGTHEMRRNTGALADNQDTTISVFAKAGGRPGIRLLLSGNDVVVRGAFFDLENGTVGTITDADAFIEQLPNGWFRCTITADANAGGGTPFGQLLIADSGEVTSYTGDGVSGVELWGFQLEADQPFGSSYIATGGATASRSEDNFFAPYLAPPISMSVYLKFIESGTRLINNARLFSITDAAAGSPNLLSRATGGTEYSSVLAMSAGTVVAADPLAAPALGDLAELLVTIRDDGALQQSFSINGAPETVSDRTDPLVLDPAWSDQRLYLNSFGNNNPGFTRFPAVKAQRGVRDLDFMRAL